MFGKDLAEMEEIKSEGEVEKEEDSKDSEKSRGNYPPKIKYNQKCEKHNLIIHSYLKTSKELLCTKCIYEKNL